MNNEFLSVRRSKMMLIRFPASLLAFVALLALASVGQPAEPTKIPIRFATPGKGQFSLGVYAKLLGR